MGRALKRPNTIPTIPSKRRFGINVDHYVIGIAPSVDAPSFFGTSYVRPIDPNQEAARQAS
jgi:hypothetical protein